MNAPRTLTLVMTCALLGCSAPPIDPAEAGASDELGDSDSSEATSASGSSTDSQGGGEGWEWGDHGEGASVCDTLLQDCPAGEKCVPIQIMDEDGPELMATCVDILGDGIAGKPCTYDGLEIGTDDCDAHHLCWDFDEDGSGTCRAFCGGTPTDPECEGEQVCWLAFDRALAVCVDPCDPLAADLETECPDTGEACVSILWGFRCLPEANSASAPGDPCSDEAPCAPGFACLRTQDEPDIVPTPCEGGHCCAQLCVPESPEPGCLGEGSSCVPLSTVYEPFAHVGACTLP